MADNKAKADKLRAEAAVHATKAQQVDDQLSAASAAFGLVQAEYREAARVLRTAMDLELIARGDKLFEANVILDPDPNAVHASIDMGDK